MSYQGQNPNQDPNSGEYGRGYTPQPQPTDPYSAGGSANQYYQPGNNPPPGNQYYQPGNNPPTGNQYNQPGTGSQYQQPPNYGQPPYNQQQYNVPQSSSFTTLGIDPRIEAVLCYVLGWVTGLIFFFLEKQDRQVRFHAMQSILFFGSLNVLMVIVGVIPFINLLSPLLVLVWIAAVIAFAIMAYTNNPYRIPYLSDYADRYTNQTKI
jgi:uncharacterized membrane protein